WVQRCLLAASLVIAATFFVLRQEYAVYKPLVPGIDPLGNVIQFGPLRRVDFAAFSVVVYWAARRIQWANVNAVAFRWLAFVGRNSLPVFAWSILVAYVAERGL